METYDTSRCGGCLAEVRPVLVCPALTVSVLGLWFEFGIHSMEVDFDEGVLEHDV